MIVDAQVQKIASSASVCITFYFRLLIKASICLLLIRFCVKSEWLFSIHHFYKKDFILQQI